MDQDGEDTAGRVPISWPIAGAVALGFVLFYQLSGATAWVPAIATAIMELGTVGLVLIAAGGWGQLVLRHVAPRSTGRMFRAVTACAVGLWMLSVAMLAMGTFVGIPNMWVSWSVVGAGVILGGLQSRRAARNWKIPRRVRRRTLLWILLGGCVGIWLVGAVRPPGFIGATDAYDVLEYHLQVPREFFLAGHISPLQHNCYSYFPLGVEMLFLFGMSLRGGAYEGVYLAKMMHGAFGILAVAGVFSALRRDENEKRRGLFAGLILASTPGVLYLSWLAFVELSVVCYLMLAVLWVREWLRESAWRAAGCVGICLGAACSMKYLSVGFVAAPVLLVMLIASLRRGKRIAQTALAALITLLLFLPWGVRNAVYTGNPVFPLATSVFGPGHWSPQEAQRWRDGHGPAHKPPVPVPPGWEKTAHPGRVEMLWNNFLSDERFGPIAMIIAGVSICALLATRRSMHLFPWDWALLGVLIFQVAVWMSTSRGMPWRFLVPAAVPIALLGAGGLARLVSAPLWRGAGGTLAGAVILGAVLVNLLLGSFAYLRTINTWDVPPYPAQRIANEQYPYLLAAKLPPGSRILLLGSATGFYFPPGTIYATVFDRQPLDEAGGKSISGAERLAGLRGMGVTHILVAWGEIWRLGGTYGYPASLSGGLYDLWQEGKGPSLPMLDKLQAAGAVLQFVGRATRLHAGIKEKIPRATRVARPTRWDPFRPPRGWPIFTLYALPPAGAPDDWKPTPLSMQD